MCQDEATVGEAAKFVSKSKIRSKTQMYTMTVPFRGLWPVGYYFSLRTALLIDYRSVIFWMVEQCD